MYVYKNKKKQEATPLAPPCGVSEEMGAGAAECVVLPLKHGWKMDHRWGMVCLSTNKQTKTINRNTFKCYFYLKLER